MEDLKNKIPEIASQYPDFAKGWIEKKLHEEVDRTGQLPYNHTIESVKNCLAVLDKNSDTIEKLDKISFQDMVSIQEKWRKQLEDTPYAILGDKLLIGDDAILACPEDTVFDYVYLNDSSNITEWNYSVSGDFDVCNSNLLSVSPDCIFGRDVDISFTQIDVWHSKIPGDFLAFDSLLERIDPGCEFGGDVDISRTDFGKEWIWNVPGDFKAECTAIEIVSPECVFGGIVDIAHTPIKEWHCDVPDNFNAESSELEYVNPECVFGDDVDIDHTENLKEWHCDVGGNLNAYSSNLEKIVDCEIKGNLNAEYSNLEQIVNCEIKGKIHCNDNVEIINEEKQVMRM